MATTIFSQSSFTSVPLSGTDGAFIASNTILAEYPGFASVISTTGSDQIKFVAGQVVAYSSGVILGNNSGSSSGQHLLVWGGGKIIDMDPSTGSAVLMRGFDNRIDNSGTVYGEDSAIVLMGGGGVASEVTNSGVIASKDDALRRDNGLGSLNSDQTIILRNAGKIRALDNAYDGATIDGVDMIYNSGLMVGRVFLGHGDDLYDGTLGGIVVGSIDGGDGSDEIRGGQRQDGARGGSGADVISGGGGADILSGDSGVDLLFGDPGNDDLRGGEDADWLCGSLGNDGLTGGAHADKFVFNTKLGPTNRDTITDFERSLDEIVLENAIFKALKSGGLSKVAFHAGIKAHDADDRIIYDKAKGAIYYDADGSGKIPQIHFASLSSTVKPALSAGDFHVI